ncbi:hypothetical protein [Paludisphaera mucosa]|uniref:Uncharacterized protein n=1 Tax=Paludisphaera mucosa TaxID=3030827 RepID=A0ABT6F4E5_9BACT|nr:hypothetical protein [Paludisphaera mucosa]MDG3002460.1 hypothetical protein [Paludisphaera mucosa]
MAPKRTTGAAAASPSHPVVTTALLLGAVGWAFGLLVHKGMMAWPPVRLLSCLATIAGCLALVGPIILARSGKGGGSLGELIWMTGGLLIWIFNLVGVANGDLRTIDWATPLGPRAMGLIILAVLLAGLRSGLAGRDWSWTNVTGWALGLFWVGMAAATWFLVPGQGLVAGLASR